MTKKPRKVISGIREIAPYSPLSRGQLGQSVANELLKQAIEPLPPSQPFIGAGIYAIYYSGAFEPYLPLTEKDEQGFITTPIYVGKAVPKGARKGSSDPLAGPGTVLYDRLAEHAESIDASLNLELKDFQCRFLVVEDIWIPLGESLLIQLFAPLWNLHLASFGNHDPGAGRYKQKKGLWDVLHPGRAWADKLQPSTKDFETLVQMVRDLLSKKEKRVD